MSLNLGLGGMTCSALAPVCERGQMSRKIYQSVQCYIHSKAMQSLALGCREGPCTLPYLALPHPVASTYVYFLTVISKNLFGRVASLLYTACCRVATTDSRSAQSWKNPRMKKSLYSPLNIADFIFQRMPRWGIQGLYRLYHQVSVVLRN
ncbi:hypothetical protein BS17DRAFT_187441 [Gyrodon lividus]|nr:hypothetical protein BS17DRAFT_187441 [Gyrodon lividus]